MANESFANFWATQPLDLVDPFIGGDDTVGSVHVVWREEACEQRGGAMMHTDIGRVCVHVPSKGKQHGRSRVSLDSTRDAAANWDGEQDTHEF